MEHSITIELLGLPRLLAQREMLEVPVHGSVSLDELVRAIGDALPSLVGTVIADDGTFVAGHVLSREGRHLLRDPEERLAPGERLLLFSTSAGG